MQDGAAGRADRRQGLRPCPRAWRLRASPLPQAGHADFCIADGNFIIAAAKSCQSRAGQRLVRFSQIKPSESEQGLTAYLGEEADYDPAQARLAGIQRLLVIAGYDANPIDGLEGKKTTAALDQFLKDRRLPADTANGAAFFQVLLDAVKEADGLGFSWCNETPYRRDGGDRRRRARAR